MGEKARSATVEGKGETPLVVLSHARTIPKWTFGSAPRWGKQERGSQRGSASVPALISAHAAGSGSHSRSQIGEGSSSAASLRSSKSPHMGGSSSSTSRKAAAAEGRSQDLSATEATLVPDQEGGSPRRGKRGAASRVLAKVPLGEGGPVCRLDSAGRLIELRMRKSEPPPRLHDAKRCLGTETAKTYTQAPSYSIGGGAARPCNVVDVPHKDRGRKSMDPDLNKYALVDFAKLGSAAAKGKPLMSRGFGTEKRLRDKGGPMEGAKGPGPGAYEVARELDTKPNWHTSQSMPYGIRTGQRADLANKAVTEIGPGEYSAGHSWASDSAPVFGHKLQEPTKFIGPSPCDYDVPIHTFDGPARRLPEGPRELYTIEDAPGPGEYSLEDRVGKRTARKHAFPRAERVHPQDLIDPDEPPGPGTHAVHKPIGQGAYKAMFPRAGGREKMAGMGPEGVPAPGEYNVQLATHSPHAHIGLPRESRIQDVPGPGTYENRGHELVYPQPPSIGFTVDKRSVPWRTVEEAERQPWESKGEFKASGPSFTIPRRYKPKVADSWDALYGPFPSIETS